MALKSIKRDPCEPVKPTFPVAAAIQALARGEANQMQQKLCLKWILESLCLNNTTTFDPESERKTCFAEGMRFVGQQILGILSTKLSKLQDKESENG